MAGGQLIPPNPLPPLPNHVHIFHLCHTTLPRIIRISLIWISPDPLIHLFAGQDHWSVAPLVPWPVVCAYVFFLLSTWYFLLLPLPHPPPPLLTSNTNTFPQSVLHGITVRAAQYYYTYIISIYPPPTRPPPPRLYCSATLTLSLRVSSMHGISELSLLGLDNTILPILYQFISLLRAPPPYCSATLTLSLRVSSMVSLCYHC